MRHLLRTAALITALAGFAAAEVEAERDAAEDAVIDATVKRVDDLLPGLSDDALKKTRERAAAIEREAVERQLAVEHGHIRIGEEREAAWRERWSQPVVERAIPREVQPETSAVTPLEETSTESEPFDAGDGIERPGVEVEDLSVSETGEPLLLQSEREVLVRNGVASFGRALQTASDDSNLRPAFLLCVMRFESNFDPEAISRAGAIGLMQLMPTTADELGANPYDLTENIRGGARLIDAHLHRYGGDVALAMAAYNAGPGAVEHYGGVPPYPETRNYVAKILRSCGDPRP